MDNKGKIERYLDVVYPLIVLLCLISFTTVLTALMGFGLYSAAIELGTQLSHTDLLLICFALVSIISSYIGFNIKKFI